MLDGWDTIFARNQNRQRQFHGVSEAKPEKEEIEAGGWWSHHRGNLQGWTGAEKQNCLQGMCPCKSIGKRVPEAAAVAELIQLASSFPSFHPPTQWPMLSFYNFYSAGG